MTKTRRISLNEKNKDKKKLETNLSLFCFLMALVLCKIWKHTLTVALRQSLVQLVEDESYCPNYVPSLVFLVPPHTSCHYISMNHSSWHRDAGVFRVALKIFAKSEETKGNLKPLTVFISAACKTCENKSKRLSVCFSYSFNLDLYHLDHSIKRYNWILVIVKYLFNSGWRSQFDLQFYFPA